MYVYKGKTTKYSEYYYCIVITLKTPFHKLHLLWKRKYQNPELGNRITSITILNFLNLV